MKTSKLQKLAWAFFALTLTATTVFSQGRNNGNRNFQNQDVPCLEQISDLNEQQKTQITAMEKSHQETMDKFREERRSTNNSIEKNEIRGAMLQSVETHQNSVKNLLTENQQKQYDLLHASGKNSKNSKFLFLFSSSLIASSTSLSELVPASKAFAVIWSRITVIIRST